MNDSQNQDNNSSRLYLREDHDFGIVVVVLLEMLQDDVSQFLQLGMADDKTVSLISIKCTEKLGLI